MVNTTDPILQECPGCGALIDVTREEPFVEMHCPTCGAAMRVRRHFDHFELEDTLGAGGMGAVYRAMDTKLNRQVALKLLQKAHSENPQFVAQFQKEAAITASINHPHVVKVFSTGQDHGRVYIVMELVDRGSLEDRMAQDEKLPEFQVLNVGIQIAQGLNAALQRGLIHRDIKPGNILFSSASTSKIVDFGLAVLMEHAGTVAGEVWGTPYYVAPEPLDGRPEDARTDMYALGATLFHALAGKPPHEANTNSMRELLEIKRTPVRVQSAAPEVSEATAFVLDKMLSFAPEDRFQTYPELIQNLENARTQLQATHAKESQRADEVDSKAALKSWNWLTFATAAVIVLAGVGGFEFRRHVLQKRAAEENIEKPRGTAVPIDQQYREACKLLAGGDAPHAAAAFAELAKRAEVTQPLLDWVLLHAGLAELLAGRDDQARAHFAEIEELGIYSSDPAEERLVNFFVETASQGVSEKPVPAKQAETLDGSNYEAFALLLFGVKDWNAGRYDEAGTFFRQFVSASPQERHAWVADYQPLARPYIGDLKAVRIASEAAQAAATLPARKAALQVVRKSKDELRTPGRLGEKLAAMERELNEAITAEETREADRVAAQEAADGKVLAEAKAKLTALEQQFKFSEAVPVAAAVKVAGPKGRAERDALVKIAEWLAQFKRTLIVDITSIGYPSPIAKRNGTQLSGGAHRANEDQIEVLTPFGTLSAHWTDLSLESIFTVAQSFLKKVPPDRLADHQWNLGVFAMHAGKTREGRDLLVQASQAKEEYRDQLGLFMEVTSPR